MYKSEIGPGDVVIIWSVHDWLPNGPGHNHLHEATVLWAGQETTKIRVTKKGRFGRKLHKDLFVPRHLVEDVVHRAGQPLSVCHDCGSPRYLVL